MFKLYFRIFKSRSCRMKSRFYKFSFKRVLDCDICESSKPNIPITCIPSQLKGLMWHLEINSFLSYRCQRTIFYTHPKNTQNHSITVKMRSNSRTGGNPQYLTSLMLHSLELRLRRNPVNSPDQSSPDITRLARSGPCRLANHF